VGVRVPIFLLVSLSLASCGAPADPSQPSGAVDPDRLATAGVENAAVREVVVDFLQAYADSGTSTETLARLVAGPDLQDWVYWLGVQNLGLQGRLTGELDLRALQVLEIGEEVAAAAVDATVTLMPPPIEGTQERIPRNFGGPVLLARTASDPTSWQVVEATRDGRSMQDSITLFEDVPARVEEDGIGIDVVSLYRFASGTVANIRIRNETKRTLRVDMPRSVLQVAGRFLGATGATATLRVPLRPGDSIDGALNFDAVTFMNTVELLMVHFHGDPAPVVTVTLPAEAFLLGSTA
jgi:hypothetical protein